MLKDNALLKIMVPVFILHSLQLYTMHGGWNDLLLGTISMAAFVFITLPLLTLAIFGTIIVFFTVKDEDNLPNDFNNPKDDDK